MHRFDPVASLQTVTRESASAQLQPSLSVKPHGYFQTRPLEQQEFWKKRLIATDDRLPFQRHRLLDIEWSRLFPDDLSGREIELAYVRDHFEKRWGATPFGQGVLGDHVSVGSVMGHSLAGDAENRSIYANWPVYGPFYRDHAFLSREGEIYWLVAAQEIDFVSAYEETWTTRLQRVVRVKKTIRSEDLIREAGKTRFRELPREPGVISPALPPVQPGQPPWERYITQPLPYSREFFTVEPSAAAFADLIRYIDENVPAEDLVAVQEFRRRVEVEWNLVAQTPDSMHFAYPRQDAPKLWVATDSNAVTATPVMSGESKLFEPAIEFKEVEPGALIFVDPVSNRKYWMKPAEGQPQLAVSSAETYEAAWRAVDSVVLLTEAETPQPEDAATSHSLILGRNEARLILDRYSQLHSELKLLEILEAKYLEWLEREVPADAGALVALQRQQQADGYLQTATRKRAVVQALEELRSMASQLGYVLFLEDQPAEYKPYENEPKAPPQIKNLVVKGPKAGNLYWERVKTARWIEQHTRKEQRRKKNGRTWYGRRKYKWVTVDVPYTKQRKSTYTSWIPVTPGTEPWQEYRDWLLLQGKEVHVISRVGLDYVSDSGTSLDDVMERCRNDETYRQRCVLFLPEYDQSIQRGFVVTKYHAISKPLPGIVPMGLPLVRLREELSFRKTLIGNELGDLTRSISLAPGERRKITYKRSFERKVDTRRTVRNFIDIESSSEQTFEDVLENEIRYESKDSTSNTDRLNLRGEGQYMGAKGSIDLTEESTDSSELSQFSREFQKTARKAANRHKKQVKEDVEVSVSDVVTSENEEGYTSEVENINQGVTLNLLYYKLTNVYQAGLFLDDFSFQLTRPFELVQGTGMFPVYYKDRRSFRDLLTDLTDFAEPYRLVGVDPDLLVNAILAEVRRILSTEYPKLPSVELPGVTDSDDSQRASETLGSKSLEELMATLQVRDAAVDHFIMDAPSEAFYMDALMGSNPATEPYSEAMRLAKLRREQAETGLVQAKATALSLAGEFMTVSGYAFVATQEGDEMKLRFDPAVPRGHWLVLHGDDPVGRLDPEQTEKSIPDDGYEVDRLRVVELGRRLEIARRA